MRRLLIGLLLVLLPTVAWAQPSIQHSPAHADAATAIALSTNFGVVNTQGVATIISDQTSSIYITGIGFEVCTNGTGTAQNQAAFTSTGITGTPQWSYSIAATPSICQRWYEGPMWLKSATPGVNVTITSPAAVTNNSYGIRIYYYKGPIQ